MNYLQREIPLTNYSKINNNSAKKLHNLRDLPKKIKDIAELKNQSITNDSADFIKAQGKKSLFICGAYNKNAKVGYIIQRFITLDGRQFNQCTLFQVQGDSLTFNFHLIPSNIFNWNDSRKYLIWPKDMSFNFGYAVFKKRRYSKQDSAPAKPQFH